MEIKEPFDPGVEFVETDEEGIKSALKDAGLSKKNVLGIMADTSEEIEPFDDEDIFVLSSPHVKRTKTPALRVSGESENLIPYVYTEELVVQKRVCTDDEGRLQGLYLLVENDAIVEEGYYEDGVKVGTWKYTYKERDPKPGTVIRKEVSYMGGDPTMFKYFNNAKICIRKHWSTRFNGTRLTAEVIRDGETAMVIKSAKVEDGLWVVRKFHEEPHAGYQVEYESYYENMEGRDPIPILCKGWDKDGNLLYSGSYKTKQNWLAGVLLNIVPKSLQG